MSYGPPPPEGNPGDPYGQPPGGDPYGQQPGSQPPQAPPPAGPPPPAPAPAQYGQPGGYPPPGADPNAPYGIDPQTGVPWSDKTKLLAGLLNILISGVGRMYAGHVGLGVAQLLVAIFTCGIGAIWSLIDGIMILANGGYDAQGRRLREQ